MSVRVIKDFKGFVNENYEDQDLFGSNEMEHNSPEMEHEEEGEETTEDDSFFDALETIKQHIDQILALDKEKIEELIKNGENWLIDHVVSAKTDIEQVCDFLEDKAGGEGNEEEPIREEEGIDPDDTTETTTLAPTPGI